MCHPFKGSMKVGFEEVCRSGRKFAGMVDNRSSDVFLCVMRPSVVTIAAELER